MNHQADCSTEGKRSSAARGAIHDDDRAVIFFNFAAEPRATDDVRAAAPDFDKFV